MYNFKACIFLEKITVLKTADFQSISLMTNEVVAEINTLKGSINSLRKTGLLEDKSKHPS